MKAMSQTRYSVNLAQHLSECDANFYRLQKLMPDMAQLDSWRFGLSANKEGLTDLLIEVVERCKYTTTLSIRLGQPTSITQASELLVRMYHDACMAEVISFQQHRHIRPRYAYPNKAMYQQDEKEQLNRFLGECLSHCLRHGHILDDVAIVQ